MDKEPIEIACHGGSLLVSDERVVRRGVVAWALWRSQIAGAGCAYPASDRAATIYLHLRDGRRFTIEDVAPRACFLLFGLLGYEAEPEAALRREAEPAVIDLDDERHTRIIADAHGVTLERSHVVAWTLPRRELTGANVSSGVSDAVVQIIGRNGPIALLDNVPFAAALRLLLVLGAALATTTSPIPSAATEAVQVSAPIAADGRGGAAARAEKRATNSPAPAAPGRPRATNAPSSGGPRTTHAPAAAGAPRATNAPEARSGVRSAVQQGEITAPLPAPPAPPHPRADPQSHQSQAPLPATGPYARQSQAPVSGATPYYRQSQSPPPGTTPYYRQSQPPLPAFPAVAALLPTAEDLPDTERLARPPGPRPEPRRRRLALGLGTAAALLVLGVLVLAVYGGDFSGLGSSLFAPRPTLIASPPPTPIPSAQPSLTAMPTSTATHAPAPTPKPAPTATKAPSPTPRPSPTPSPTATPTATPSPTPSPTPTVTPTSTATP